MKKFRTLFTIACMAFVMMVTGVKARAMEGSGTVDDPYIVTDYAEFAEKLNTMELYGVTWYDTVVQEAPPTYYFKLGQDIYSDDKINDDMILNFGRAKLDTGTGWCACTSENFVLDLAGHSIKRKTKSTDYAIIYLNSGTLTIEDSVGGGKVESDFGEAFSYSTGMNYVIYVRNIRRDLLEKYSCNLVINGGEFCGLNKQCIYASDINGSVTINDGIFVGDVKIYKDSSWSNTSLCVNGGSFTKLSVCCNGCLRDCNVTEYLYSQYKLVDTVYSDSVVTVDSKRIWNLKELQVLEGNIVITDPTKPKITSQPSAYVFPYVGASNTFRIFAENAESYEWRVRDDKGIDRSWDYFAFKGAIQLSDGNIYNNVLSLDKANIEDRLQLYCVVRGNGYVLKSKPVDLTTEHLIKEIPVEIENFEDAVVGANIGDFTKVTLDYLSHGTASDATWYSYYEPVEGEMEWGESYVISFSVDLDQGYELDPKARCIVKTPKGDVVATKLAGSNATHANYEFTYEPPLPENGIKIELVSRSIKVPTAGEVPAGELDPLSGAEALDCPYVVRSVTWDPSPATFAEGEFAVLTIVYKAKDGYGFYDDTKFLLNGEEMTVDEIVKGIGGTATVTCFFEVQGPESLKITFKHNIEFDNNIAMHYIVPKSELQGYLNLKLVIDKEVYAEGVATPTIQQFVLENPTPYEVNGVDYWHFTFPGISASEMGNALSAKVVCEKNGVTYESLSDVYTVKDYAYGRLAKTSSASYKKVLVDMLNYGAAAQAHFKKNAGKPVNADLTDEQRAFGSSLEDFSVKNVEKVLPLEGTATASFDAKNLVFGSNVELVYRMDFSNFKKDSPEGTTEDQKMANVKVVLKYNNGKGEKTVTVPYSQFTKNKGKYVASCSELTPAEMGCTVNATIYDGEVPISDTLQYSIESYVDNRLSGTGTNSETFKELLKRMVLYGKAVKEHF